MTDDWWPEHELRTRAQPPRDGLDRMIEALDPGGTVLDVQLLRGGIINSTHALDIRMSDGATKRYVLKRFLFSADEARREWDSLVVAERARVPTPQPVVFDGAGGWFGEAAMLVTLLPGLARIPDDSGKLPELLGDTLAEIHRCDIGDRSAVPRETFWSRSAMGSEGILSDVGEAVERRLSGMEPSDSALLHGDFWTGNILWRDGQVSGVVDWGRSCVGPRGYDVAYARVDMDLLWGADAAERFTAAYSRAAGPVPDLPLWDLVCGYDALQSAVWWMRGYRALGRGDFDLERIEAHLPAFLRRALARE